MHKSQMFFLSAVPRAVNMLEHGDANQTTTNKCFLLPTAAILKQITKGLFGALDSRRLKTCFSTFSSSQACGVSRGPLESSFGRVTSSSLRAKQTAVAYG